MMLRAQVSFQSIRVSSSAETRIRLYFNLLRVPNSNLLRVLIRYITCMRIVRILFNPKCVFKLFITHDLFCTAQM